jgi:hypothetical protein
MQRLEAGFQISQCFSKIGRAPEETVHAMVLVDTSVLVDDIDRATHPTPLASQRT